jgi:hypothetical protein
MSTNLTTKKDVVVSNKPNDIFSLLRRGIIKRSDLVGVRDEIVIKDIPVELAKKINASVAVTIDGIYVPGTHPKKIDEIYATIKEVVEEKEEEKPVVATLMAPVEEETATIETTESNAEMIEETPAEVETPVEEIVTEEEVVDEEESIEETAPEYNSYNAYSYKKKKRR